MNSPTRASYGADEARPAGSSGTPAPAVSGAGRTVGDAGSVRVELPDAEVEYRRGFFGPDEARELFEALRAEVRWEQHRVRVRGREVDCPRLSGWEGDATYSTPGSRSAPRRGPRGSLRSAGDRGRGGGSLQQRAREPLPGRERPPRLARDDEPELGPAPVIASASFGAPRRFLLRPKRGGASVPIVLEPGSLLVMRGPTQRHWLHSVPPTRRPVGPRINLTFRRIRAR